MVEQFHLTLALLLLGMTGCVQEDLESPLELPLLNVESFRCEVHPILLRTCAFGACHSDPDRRFRLFAPHRLRLAGEIGLLSETEIEANFNATLGFLQSGSSDAWLLLKPLDSSAGGYFHVGKEMFGGGDVFLSTSDPDYRTIASWVDGTLQDSTACSKGEEQ